MAAPHTQAILRTVSYILCNLAFIVNIIASVVSRRRRIRTFISISSTISALRVTQMSAKISSRFGTTSVSRSLARGKFLCCCSHSQHQTLLPLTCGPTPCHQVLLPQKTTTPKISCRCGPLSSKIPIFKCHIFGFLVLETPPKYPNTRSDSDHESIIYFL